MPFSGLLRAIALAMTMRQILVNITLVVMETRFEKEETNEESLTAPLANTFEHEPLPSHRFHGYPRICGRKPPQVG